MFKKISKKSTLVIGLGRFGTHLAKKLKDLGNDVMVIDKNEDVIQEEAGTFEDALVADFTKENVIKSLGVNNFDICFVATNESFSRTAIATSLLKSEGAPYVVARAGSLIEQKILKEIGADEVVYPEKDYAEKLAYRSQFSKVLDRLELGKDYAIYEIDVVPEKWLGKSMIELDLRKKQKITILLAKHKHENFAMPEPSYVFRDGDKVVIMGKDSDIIKALNV
jgi:trk system potassium uptake protein TrkA